MNKLSLATFNVNGLKDRKKRKALFTKFRASNYDIIFLQETHCHHKQEKKVWSLEWDGQSIWSLGSNHSKGVCVLFNRNYNFDYCDVVCDVNGRYISFDLKIENSKFHFLNVYAPNIPNERISFFKMIQRYVNKDYENVVGGDFNCTLNPLIDRLNCTGLNDVGNRELLEIMHKFDLEDVCRRRYPEKKMFSWSRGIKASRIDMWLISKSLDNQVDKCKYKVCPLSDHDIAEVTFRTSETKFGKGIWKMNTDILMSELFQKSFKSFWSHWQIKKSDYKDIGKWWDIGKKKIKDLTINVAKSINKSRKEEIDKLEKEIENAQVANKSMESIEEMKRNLKKLLEHKGEGARIRSRVKWFEEGEKSSKYFFNLEKRNAKEKAWENILDADGNIVCGLQNILETQVKFYSDLYTAEAIQPDDTFLKAIDSELTDDQSQNLDRDITMLELTKSLKLMKNNKSPGPDGIVTEFYKFYWKDIGQDLFEVFQNSLNKELLPQSQYLAVIRLIFKKGERENLKNWRPISLLNTDYKILTKLLAERLIEVLPHIIHRDQKGCVKGRNIGENIILIRDLVEQCEENEVIILVDQQKAFDRVELSWLFQVLDKFKFGKSFISCLKTLYKDMKSCILTNGYVSSVFPVTRGIRQGDSLSALLYILQLEPLSAYFRKTQRINGIKLEGFNSAFEVRNKHYVDDTIICLNHINMTDECLDIIEEFGKVSGSKLNREKTIGLVMSDRVINSNTVLSHVRFTLGPVNVLGIPVGKNEDENFWDSIIEKIGKQFAMWKNRHLSLTGKVLIVKSLGMSKLLFSSNFISMNDREIKKIEKLFFDFIWEGKKNRVNREVCVLPRNKGGLGMVDLRTSIKTQKIKWIKRILQAEDHDEWAMIPLRNLKCLDRKYKTEYFALRVSDQNTVKRLGNVNKFYSQCIEAFQELCNVKKILTTNDIIWCNNNVTFNGKTLEFSHWAQSGLLYIKDVIINDKLNENFIYNSLLFKASFYFDLYKLKISLPPASIKQIKHVETENSYDSYTDKRKYILEMIIENTSGNISFEKLKSKDIYSILLKSKVSEIKVKSKAYWQEKFSNQQLNFQLWYMCNFTNSLTPRKCADFNWKIFYGKVNVGTRLLKMKISNGMCNLCKSQLENLEHLLYDCIFVQGIWKNIFDDILIVFNIKLDKFTVIVGYLNNSSKSFVTNMILSICRWIIWKRRNLFNYENRYLDNMETTLWIKSELITHCNTLLNCKTVHRDQDTIKALNLITKKFQ